MVWLLSLILLLLAAWTALRFLPAGAEGRQPLPYMIALIPFLWIPALVCAAVAGVLSYWWVCAAAIAEAVVVTALQAPYWRRRFAGTWLESLLRRHRTGRGDGDGTDRRDASPYDTSACDTAPSVASTSATTRSITTVASATVPTGTTMASGAAPSGTIPTGTALSGAASRTVSPSVTTPTTAVQPAEPYRCPLARFTVMTLNCRYGRANAEAIVAAVRTHSVAVLALQELTAGLVEDLETNGLSLLLPYRQLGQEKLSDNGGFNGIWTRFMPEDMTPAAVDIPAADVPSVTVAFPQPVPEYEIVDGDGRERPEASGPDADRTGTVGTGADAGQQGTVMVTFASAHPKSPMRGCRAWSDGIIGLGALARPRFDGVDRCDCVVLGDLNSGLHHPSFRRLLAQGFHDADLSIAQGPTMTFPSWIPWPRIELDHVLCTDGVTAGHIESFRIDGSDHLAVAVSLIVHP